MQGWRHSCFTTLNYGGQHVTNTPTNKAITHQGSKNTAFDCHWIQPSVFVMPLMAQSNEFQWAKTPQQFTKVVKILPQMPIYHTLERYITIQELNQ